MAKGSPSLQTRAKRWGVIGATALGSLALVNTLANRNVPVLGMVAQKIRTFVNSGV